MKTKSIRIGIQLYTVRDACAKDFKGTVKAIAEMGYQGVETAWNYGNMPPEELAAFLKEVGLSLCGQHLPLAQILDPASQGYAYARVLGCPYVTTSLAGSVGKEWKPTIAKVAEAGKTAMAQKCIFTYHNHAQEFATVDGMYALDLLYRQTDFRAVQAELDTYWIKKGGADPVPYIRQYKGRVPQIHLKDMDPSDGTFTEVGNGLMDLPGLFAVAKEVGAKWIIVEQDVSKRNPVDSARISMENLKKVGLA